VIQGGVLKSYSLSDAAGLAAGLAFVQISDSHMGFNKAANPVSKPSEFDTVDQVLKRAKAKQVFFVPGEHDVIEDNGQQYLTPYGKGRRASHRCQQERERLQVALAAAVTEPLDKLDALFHDRSLATATLAIWSSAKLRLSTCRSA